MAVIKEVANVKRVNLEITNEEFREKFGMESLTFKCGSGSGTFEKTSSFYFIINGVKGIMEITREELVKAFAPELLEYGQIVETWLGVDTIKDGTEYKPNGDIFLSVSVERKTKKDKKNEKEVV